MMQEISEFQDTTKDVELPKKTIHDNVLITPSYMKFRDAIEGITLRECLTIRNIGEKIAFVRIHEPNSIALSIKTLRRGTILSPGLALKRWVSYSFRRPAIVHAFIPIEINGHIIDYQIICIFNIEYIEVAPTSIDFGIVDIGCSSGIKLLTIKNVGGKSTRFTVDLGNNDMDMNVRPHRGVVRPRSIVKLHIRMIGISEGTFFNEFWIKSSPNIRVPVKAKIIIPRLEIDYPNTTGDFTLVDFSSTFFGVKKYDILTLKNISSQFSSFVVLAEIENQLIPFPEIDLIKYPAYEAFEINRNEGRLESFQGIDFIISFYPKINLMQRENKIHSLQDFMIFLRIVRVHCTEVEDILRAEKRTEPKPDDPPLHKIHIQDSSTYSSNSSASTIPSIHRAAELVRLCLHGEAERTQLRFIPNELHFKISKVNKSAPQTITIENLSKKSSVTVSVVKNGIVNCIPPTIHLNPQNTSKVTIKIAGRKYGHVECTFELIFNVFVDSINSQWENIKAKIATYSLKCFFTLVIPKIMKWKKSHYKMKKKSHTEFPHHLIEIEKCKPLTFESLGLIDSNILKNSIKSIDTTTMPLSPLQIYHVKISPTMFTFGSVAQRVPSYQELTVQNQNKFSVMVRLTSLSVKNIRFLPNDTIILKPNQSMTRLIEFRGDQIGKFNSYIDYIINNHHTYELALTADVNYKYLTLRPREIIIGSNYLPQESYRPLESYIQLKNRLNAKTNFKWDIPTIASYTINPLIGVVRGRRKLWINILHISNFSKSDQTEAVVICEGGHQMTLKLNTILPILKVAFLNDIIDVGEISLNLPHKVKNILHNAGNTEVLFQVDSTGLPDGCNVHPQRGYILPRGIIIIVVTLKFRACVQFTVNINVSIHKKKNLTLKIKGEVAFPKIKFTPTNIEFGRISVGSYRIYHISAKNNGNVPITLTFPLEEFPEFRILLTEKPSNNLSHDNITIELLPGAIQSFYLHFQPINLASYTTYLPIIINDLLGPIILKNSDTLQPKKFLHKYEMYYSSIAGIKLKNISTTIAKIYIEGTVLGKILIYNKLNFSFDVEQNFLTDVLRILNISTFETPFTIHIDKIFMKNSPFFIEWDSGKELVCDSNTEFFTCFLSPKEEVHFRIHYISSDQGFFTADIPISASGEFGAKMFNIIHLEGRKFKPSITSDTHEIFFNSIPLNINAKHFFHVVLNNYPKNTMIIGDVEEPQKYSGNFSKNILTITFPLGNHSLTNKDLEKMDICLSLKSKCSVSFKTTISIRDERNEATLFIVVKGVVDNCLLTTHAYSILSYESIASIQFHHFNTEKSSYPSLCSEISKNESKTHINNIKSHISDSQLQCNTHSVTTSTNKSLQLLTSSPKLINNDNEDEITVIHESKMSLLSSKTTKNQPFQNSTFADNKEIEYEQHMQRTLEAVEKWMYSNPLQFQFNPDIPCGLTAALSGLCSLKRASSDKRKIHTVDKSFLNILSVVAGEEIHNYFTIPKLLPVNNNERINLVLNIYENVLAFLLSKDAHVSHINSKYLLNYDDYCVINDGKNITATIFETCSKQNWLDVILQTYKQFVLSKIILNAMVNTASNPMIYQSIDIIRSVSSTNCIQFLSESDIDIISRKAKEKNHFEPEAILLAWLEYHYEYQWKENWLHTHACPINSTDNKANGSHRSLNNFTSDLIDSLVLITVTASYCPYLINEYFCNIFIKPKCPEEYLHNSICVIRAWRKIRLGFIITPEEIVRPNSVQMLMLVVHLFQILPTYLAGNKVKFFCPLTENVVRHIGINNISESPVSIIVEFFGNNLELFNIVDSGSIFKLNAHDSKTIKIKYHARKINKARAYLLMCGSAIGPNFAKNHCFILEGSTSQVESVDKYKIKTEMYCVIDKVIGIKVPYNFEADYDIWITEEMPSKPYLKMTRWSELCKKKVPRRLFINQKTLAVIENAHKANLSITVACIAPDIRNFWLIFQSKFGDFIVQIISVPRSSLIDSINVKWKREKCICSLPKISDICPLYIKIEIPSRNIQLWNSIHKMFHKCLNSRDQIFWSKHLDTDIGLKLIRWLMESHEDNTAKEFFHIFNINTNYSVSILDKENHIIYPELFNIPDVRQLHKKMEMKIHLSESFPELYSTVMILISQDKREQRNYNITLVCENSHH